MDVGGTIPWMESVESSLEQRPRATHGDKAEDRMSVATSIPSIKLPPKGRLFFTGFRALLTQPRNDGFIIEALNINVIPAKAGICRTGCANAAKHMDVRERPVNNPSLNPLTRHPGIFSESHTGNFSGFVPGTLCNACGLSF